MSQQQQKARYITLTPAFGREYKSRTAIFRDWKDNKDFQVASAVGVPRGTYCSKSTADREGLTVVIYYNRYQNQVVIKPNQRV